MLALQDEYFRPQFTDALANLAPRPAATRSRDRQRLAPEPERSLAATDFPPAFVRGSQATHTARQPRPAGPRSGRQRYSAVLTTAPIGRENAVETGSGGRAPGVRCRFRPYSWGVFVIAVSVTNRIHFPRKCVRR